MAKQKPAKVTVTRVRQMADSLMNSSKNWKETAFDFNQMSKGIPYNKTGQKYAEIYGTGASKSELVNTSNGMQKRASADSTKAVRLRALADKASAGRDKPLPSSDGIISTITNKISELFK
jgi:hypothetical protein